MDDETFPSMAPGTREKKARLTGAMRREQKIAVLDWNEVMSHCAREMAKMQAHHDYMLTIIPF